MVDFAFVKYLNLRDFRPYIEALNTEFRHYNLSYSTRQSNVLLLILILQSLLPIENSCALFCPNSIIAKSALYYTVFRSSGNLLKSDLFKF